jgi:hypothetical protein
MNIITEVIHNEQQIHVVTHRIQLAKQLYKRFGIDHIEELKASETKGILGYSLCIDSLHEKSKARFNSNDAEDAVIHFIEENQILWHALGSNTCQENHVVILQNLEDTVKMALASNGKPYLSSADVNPKEINYFSALTQHPRCFMVENTYNPN